MGNLLNAIRGMDLTGQMTTSKETSSQQLSQHHFNKQEVRLMRQFLKDFTCHRHARPQDCKLVVWHWEQLNVVHYQPIDKVTGVAPIMQLFDVFYRFLFELAPEIKPLYHNSAQFQGQALLNIIGGVRSLLQCPDVFETAAAIAIRHVTYGVKCEHFNPFGVALMRTLEVLAPTLWTPQISEAWRRVYAHVSLLVLSHLNHESLLLSQRSNAKIAVDSAASPNAKTKLGNACARQPARSESPSAWTDNGIMTTVGSTRVTSSPPRSRKSSGTEDKFSDL